ncbi:MAG TPA: hypothetical protein VNP95_13640 [Thermomicrobiales bacterium]|nr:hypothetical protein [Thermomicrobiales bacterium]
MKAAIHRHPLIAWASLIVLVLAIAFGSYLFYLAYSVDALPWQTVPTPYAGPAFQGIPGFGSGATATPVP